MFEVISNVVVLYASAPILKAVFETARVAFAAGCVTVIVFPPVIVMVAVRGDVVLGLA